jgi:hypothetical protein
MDIIGRASKASEGYPEGTPAHAVPPQPFLSASRSARRVTGRDARGPDLPLGETATAKRLAFSEDRAPIRKDGYPRGLFESAATHRSRQHIRLASDLPQRRSLRVRRDLRQRAESHP